MSTAASRPPSDPLRVVLMGVAGSGKSTVGAALSAAIGVPYADGDDLHPAENIAKMSRANRSTTTTGARGCSRWPTGFGSTRR